MAVVMAIFAVAEYGISFAVRRLKVIRCMNSPVRGRLMLGICSVATGARDPCRKQSARQEILARDLLSNAFGVLARAVHCARTASPGRAPAVTAPRVEAATHRTVLPAFIAEPRLAQRDPRTAHGAARRLPTCSDGLRASREGGRTPLPIATPPGYYAPAPGSGVPVGVGAVSTHCP